MAKDGIRVIVVRKWVTVTLWIGVSIAILALILFLSGRTYVRDRSPVLVFLSLLQRYDRGVLTNSAVVAALMPPLANVFLFLPWGFLAFLALDRPERPRLRSHGLVTLAGLLFAVAIAAWQYELPTHVTSWYDSLWHGLGALAGSLLGHLRKRVHVQFR